MPAFLETLCLKDRTFIRIYQQSRTDIYGWHLLQSQTHYGPCQSPQLQGKESKCQCCQEVHSANSQCVQWGRLNTGLSKQNNLFKRILHCGIQIQKCDVSVWHLQRLFWRKENIENNKVSVETGTLNCAQTRSILVSVPILFLRGLNSSVQADGLRHCYVMEPPVKGSSYTK